MDLQLTSYRGVGTRTNHGRASKHIRFSYTNYTIGETNRVLEVVRILMSTLTPEELDQLREIMSSLALDHHW
jgi:hypothetical protein